MTEVEFKGMDKIYRLFREIVITEKIDGTNAHVHIDSDGTIRAASRNRYLTLDNDNYGFAAWVEEHKESLLRLRHGRHYGEWWGAGIQRNYGMTERYFTLFRGGHSLGKESVPVLYKGVFSEDAIRDCLSNLKKNGSVIAPGFMNPEGIVICHVDGRHLWKVTLDGDGHKGIK